MADGYDTGNLPFYNRTIRTRIGAALRAMYDSELSQPIPHRLFTLLIDLDEPAEVEEANRLFTLLSRKWRKPKAIRRLIATVHNKTARPVILNPSVAQVDGRSSHCGGASRLLPDR
jgi:hypothetical protein